MQIFIIFFLFYFSLYITLLNGFIYLLFCCCCSKRFLCIYKTEIFLSSTGGGCVWRWVVCGYIGAKGCDQNLINYFMEIIQAVYILVVNEWLIVFFLRLCVGKWVCILFFPNNGSLFWSDVWMMFEWMVICDYWLFLNFNLSKSY